MSETPKLKPEILVSLQRQRFRMSREKQRAEDMERLEEQCAAYRQSAANEARG